jgi:hypothetical protein
MRFTRDWLFSLGSRTCGVSLISIGAVVTAAGFWAIFSHPFESGWRAWLDDVAVGLLIMLACLGIGAAISFSGVLVFNFGRRLVSPSADQKLRSDPRSPVLYMRSFADDKLSRRTHMMLLPGMLLLRTLRTEEEQISRVFDRLGPVIAIGEPGEELPPLGAARLLVAESQWKPEVRALMDKARLLLIRAGTSPGVLWEISAAVEQNRPEALLLIVSAEQQEYGSFCAAAQPLFTRGLPQWAGRVENREHPLAVIDFDGTWTPTFRPLKIRRYSLAPLEGALKRFLKKNSNIRFPRSSTGKRVAQAGTSFLRRTAIALLAATVGVPLAFTAIPKLKVVANRHRPHLFLASPLDRFTATLPPPLRETVRPELMQSPNVRQWVEDSPSEVWTLFGHDVRSGLRRLPDEDLLDWSTVFQENLLTKDATHCAAMVRSLADRTDESENSISILASGTPPHLIPKLSRVLVKAAEAELSHAPLRPVPTGADRVYAMSELERLLSGEAKRFEGALINGPDRVADADVCWFQATWMKMIQKASPRSRSAVITMYTCCFSPDVWRQDADERKRAIKKEEETERLRRLFRF